MGVLSPEKKYRYDMFMLRHKRTFLLVAIVVLLVVLAGLVDMLYYKSFDINFLGQGSQQTAQQTTQQPTGSAQQPAGESMRTSSTGVTITGVHVSNGVARTFIKNTGSANTGFASVVLYDIYGNSIPTDTKLDRVYKPGDEDALTFTDPGISCSTFSKVTVNTDVQGVSDTYSEKPTCL